MQEPAAREFAEGLIRERIAELARNRQTVVSSAPAGEEEVQRWEEVR